MTLGQSQLLQLRLNANLGSPLRLLKDNMADDLDLDLGEDQDEVSKAEKRIKSLSDKVRVASQERDDLATAKTQLEAEKATLAKESTFYKDFNTIMPKYQGATEFQDKIKEKVMAGYDIEDATVSVLNKEGKLNPAPITERRESPAGGSSINQIRSEGEKTIEEMTRDEKRAKLMENEGEMIDLLSPKIRM